MSNFTPLVTKTLQFEGEEVKVTFARLKRKHMLQLIPHFLKYKEDADTETKMQLFAPIIDVIGDHAPEYIRSIDGVTTAEGEPVSIVDVVEGAYFLDLFADIIVSMIEASTPKGKT
jgi:hypothetical protein